ncbi:MAG: hypothetical protein RMY34_34370 [Aulosira sp. DedQUE10]|nr:hypothetical protein [Aulosira sp. DedQUE10]
MKEDRRLFFVIRQKRVINKTCKNIRLQLAKLLLMLAASRIFSTTLNR